MSLLLAILAPKLVGPGVISTRFDEVSGAEGPDGLFVFTRMTASTWFGHPFLCQSTFRKGRWTRSVFTSFSGTAYDLNPSFSPDGKRLYFSSNRTKAGKMGPDFDIWYVDRQASGWTQPASLPAEINSPEYEFSVSQAQSRNLYFTRYDKGLPKAFLSSWKDGAYQTATEIKEFSGDGIVPDICVAPDESFAVFTRQGSSDEMRASGVDYSRGDLYISLRQDGRWQKPIHLPAPINSVGGESAPSLSLDGKYLYFSSDRGFASNPSKTHRLTYGELKSHMAGLLNCAGNIYRVPLQPLLRSLRPKENRRRTASPTRLN